MQTEEFKNLNLGKKFLEETRQKTNEVKILKTWPLAYKFRYKNSPTSRQRCRNTIKKQVIQYNLDYYDTFLRQMDSKIRDIMEYFTQQIISI